MLITPILQGLFLIGALIIGITLIFRYFLGVGVGAPYLPIHTKYLKSLFIELDIRPGMTVMDLGSGDGKILLEAAKRDTRVIGYEINPLLTWISQWRLRAWKNDATIYRKNLFEADISRADIIFVFGITGMMFRLSQKLLREGKAGAQIVSFAFELPGFAESERRGIAFLYRIPQRTKEKIYEG